VRLHDPQQLIPRLCRSDGRRECETQFESCHLEEGCAGIALQDSRRHLTACELASPSEAPHKRGSGHKPDHTDEDPLLQAVSVQCERLWRWLNDPWQPKGDGIDWYHLGTVASRMAMWGNLDR
jgi:hypothetical protein